MCGPICFISKELTTLLRNTGDILEGPKIPGQLSLHLMNKRLQLEEYFQYTFSLKLT